MLKKLCAFGVLALAFSPFTAPFQTYQTDNASFAGASTALMAPLHSISGLPDEHDPGSLVAPRSTAPGRLTITPLLGLALTSFVPVCPAVSLTRSVTATVHIGDGSSNLPTVLRL